MTNTELLKAFVDHMNAGRYDQAREMVADDIVIHEPPSLPYGGDFSGIAEFDRFRQIFAATWRRWSDGPMWYAENGDSVIKFNVVTATSRETGRTYTTPLAEIFTFRDGQICESYIFYHDVPAFLEAIAPPTSAD